MDQAIEKIKALIDQTRGDMKDGGDVTDAVTRITALKQALEIIQACK